MTSYIKGLAPIPQRIAMDARDIQDSFGLGRRAARQMARTLGRKVGKKYLVSVASILRYLDAGIEKKGRARRKAIARLPR